MLEELKLALLRHRPLPLRPWLNWREAEVVALRTSPPNTAAA
jgi:hypothetical protein